MSWYWSDGGAPSILPCTQASEGGCTRTRCPPSDAGFDPSSIRAAPNAGDVTAQGASGTYRFRRTDAGFSGYAAPSNTTIPASGEALAVTGVGGTDVAPFMLSTAMPTDTGLAAPFAPDGSVSISTAAPLDLALSTASTGDLELNLYQQTDGGFDSFNCRFGAGGTHFVVPQSMLQGRTGTSPFNLSLMTEVTTQVGAFDVTFTGTTYLLLADGGVLFGARFQ
jgi:hypothetical protein